MTLTGKQIERLHAYNAWSDITIDEIECIRAAYFIGKGGCNFSFLTDYECFPECYNMEGELIAYA